MAGLNLKDLTGLINNGEPFHSSVKRFINDFIDSNDRQSLIKEIPESINMKIGLINVPSPVHDVMIAGIVEELCDEFDMKKPDWLFSSRYYFNRPHFLTSNISEKHDFMFTTPRQYSKRNLFCGAMLQNLLNNYTQKIKVDKIYNELSQMQM